MCDVPGSVLRAVPPGSHLILTPILSRGDVGITALNSVTQQASDGGSLAPKLMLFTMQLSMPPFQH